MGQATNIFFDILKIWTDQNELYSVQGSVKSISESDRTCVVTPSDGGPDLQDVRLEADHSTSASKGFFIVPAVGSLVIATFLNSTDAFLSAWTSIDKVISKQTNWIFNDGANEGIVKSIETTNKLNNLENKVNALITFINAHVHITVAPTLPTTVPTPPFTGAPLVPTIKTEIQNSKVTH